MTIDNFTDQLNLIAGNFSKDISEFFSGHVEPFAFILAPRARRHLWLALIEISPAQARSGLVRFGFDADPAELVKWTFDNPPPMLWPVLRRCMPAAALPRGFYSQIAEHLWVRARTGRVWAQIGSMERNEWAATLALPAHLIERSVISLMSGNVGRAEAVSDLWGVALDQPGRDPSNLRRAICEAADTEKLEALLRRAVQADQLPIAPTPDEHAIRPILTKRQLETYGHRLRNCMARSQSFGLRNRSDAFFLWVDEAEGDVMIRCEQDHHMGWWRLAEARLKNNRRPSDDLRRKIACAFESVGVRDRPSVSDLLLAL